MINPNELLHTQELVTRGQAQSDSEHPPVTLSDAQAMFGRRLSMLRSLRHKVSAPLYDALQAKVAHEEASFVSIIESCEREREARKRLNKTLKAEYFTQKPLPSHIF